MLGKINSPFLVALCLAFFISLVFAPLSENMQYGTSATVNEKTNITALNVTINETSFQAGATVNFTTSFFNSGNTNKTLNASVFIRNDIGTLIDILNYSQFNISMGSYYTIGNLTWDSTGQSAGTYTAYSNASYDSGLNFTNTVNIIFTITASAAPPPVSSIVLQGSPQGNFTILSYNKTTKKYLVGNETATEEPKADERTIKRLGDITIVLGFFLASYRIWKEFQ